MKRVVYILSLLWLGAIGCMSFASPMYHWKAHLAYGSTQQVESHGDQVYALAHGALYSVEKQSEELATWSKLTGLNGSIIEAMGYNDDTESLLLVYQDGLMDVIKGDHIYSITDLKLKDLSSPKIPNKVYMYNHLAYLAMPFGILCVDMKKREIESTYYIGEEGSAVDVKDVTWLGDTIYAISENRFYAAPRNCNLSDFSNWTAKTDPDNTQPFTSLAAWEDQLWVLRDTALFTYDKGVWTRQKAEYSWYKMRVDRGRLFLINTNKTAYELKTNGVLHKVVTNYEVEDIQKNGNDYWMAIGGWGLVRINEQEGTQQFIPNGPITNESYRLKIEYGKLYMLPGARWGDRYNRPGRVMIYDGNLWSGINVDAIVAKTGHPATDFMNVAVDPFDHDHYFVTSYGTGLYEFNGLKLKKQYHHYNSPLETLAHDKNEFYYIRTDGAIYDENGYLWFINSSDKYLHIVPPDSLIKYESKDTIGWFKTVPREQGNMIPMYTPGEMFIDKRNSNYKWIPDCRYTAGLVLFDDNGTPLRDADDKAIFRYKFEDQDGKSITCERLYTAVQDAENDIWVGYESGIFVIRNTTDFFRSNACERIKIPRNDGTNLADYLLNGEQVNAIAIDGMNRKWIGTATSGLYLMSADGIETIEHFTVDNSPLLSDEVLSLAVHPQTGEVFIGTALGLMSYQSDATEPEENFSNAYAYPNPVRPDYQGIITITGLMDETVLYIIDSGANLVCKTRSNGGTAIWDGRNASGHRVAPGVYSVLCNTADGENHCVTKILIIR